MKTLSLPGIRKIGYVNCSALSPELMMKSIAGAPIAILTDIKDVPFTGEPSCKAVDDNDNNGRCEKSTLEFITTSKIPVSSPIAFIVQCVNGKQYIIGTAEAPFPIVKITNDTGARAGNASAFAVEVTHSAIKSLIEINI